MWKTVSGRKEKKPKSGKGMTLKSLFLRCWVIASLGLLIIMGASAGSTLMIYNELSTDSVRLEAEIQKSAPGSFARAHATRRLTQVKRNIADAQQALLQDALWAFIPPLLALVVAYLISLLLPAREEAEPADETPISG